MNQISHSRVRKQRVEIKAIMLLPWGMIDTPQGRLADDQTRQRTDRVDMSKLEKSNVCGTKEEKE